MKVTKKFDKKAMDLQDLKCFIETATAAGCTPDSQVTIVAGFKTNVLEVEMRD